MATLCTFYVTRPAAWLLATNAVPSPVALWKTPYVRKKRIREVNRECPVQGRLLSVFLFSVRRDTQEAPLFVVSTRLLLQVRPPPPHKKDLSI
jgi:hypothetical protein